MNNYEYKSTLESCEDLSGMRESVSVKKVDIPVEQDAEARGNMYQFFSSCYLQPLGLDLLQQILNTEFLRELSVLFVGEGMDVLKEFATTADFDKDFESLKQEYMDLFAVPTGRYVVPFEDAYYGKCIEEKDDYGPLMGARTIAVKKLYRGAGAEMEQTCKELPTHIGIELSFMKFLCQMEMAEIKSAENDPLLKTEEEYVTNSCKYQKMQIRFLQNHLNKWFPQLSQKIQANAKSKFYRGIAMITEEFLANDEAILLCNCLA